MTNAERTAVNRTHRPVMYLAVGFCLIYCLALKLLPYVLTATGTQGEWFSMVFPWSLTPILAVGMFAGALLANRWMAISLMLAMLLVGDLGIWLISGHFDWAFYPGTPFNYACLLGTAVLGYSLRNDRSWIKPIGLGLVAGVVFFIVSNFGSWLTLPEYTKDFSGLARCYVNALPFFRNLLAGTFIGSVILFCPALLEFLLPTEARARSIPDASRSVQ
ncbi:hypothetical protein GC197_18120 [bacterium]|nr:hypothetical protein [bacterium]